jgi:hypothetical protein
MGAANTLATVPKTAARTDVAVANRFERAAGIA